MQPADIYTANIKNKKSVNNMKSKTNRLFMTLTLLILFTTTIYGRKNELLNIKYHPVTQMQFNKTFCLTGSGKTFNRELCGLGISINSAGLSQLTKLPGIGPKRAKDIISYRIKNGPFHTPEELCNIKGIGPKTVKRLLPWLSEFHK